MAPAAMPVDKRGALVDSGISEWGWGPTRE